mmetsp:Transcript_15076/g.22182  ORF Transcript_15076/g.22182 Transcript_15076/m.22182 type:complete len:88 (-) Transcript_15076:107-370(-)
MTLHSRNSKRTLVGLFQRQPPEHLKADLVGKSTRQIDNRPWRQTRKLLDRPETKNPKLYRKNSDPQNSPGALPSSYQRSYNATQEKS